MALKVKNLWSIRATLKNSLDFKIMQLLHLHSVYTFTAPQIAKRLGANPIAVIQCLLNLASIAQVSRKGIQWQITTAGNLAFIEVVLRYHLDC